MWKSTVVFALSALLASRAALGAGPLNRPLKSAQVACVESRLFKVERRLITYGKTTFGAGSENGASPLNYGRLALWHSAPGHSQISGLVRIVDFGLNVYYNFLNGALHYAEADLAFDLSFKNVSPLNPTQRRRPEALLARRNSGTNLSLDHPGCYDIHPSLGDVTCPAILSLDLSRQALDPTHPETALVINAAAAEVPDRTSPGSRPLPVAEGTGEGILTDRLLDACGGGLTDFDEKIFNILARTILPSVCFWLPNPDVCSAGDYSGSNMAIFRGADPHVYRVNVYLYTNAICDDNGECSYGHNGPLALEVRIDWDGAGHLTKGTATVLPPCKHPGDLGCTYTDSLSGIGLYFLPPIYPGHQEQQPAAFKNAPFLTLGVGTNPVNITFTRINWARLLQGTGLDTP